MGYGEFGGGGSVKYRIKHSNDNPKPQEHDQAAPKGTEGGLFYVWLPDGLKGPYHIDDHNDKQIIIYWTPDKPPMVP